MPPRRSQPPGEDAPVYVISVAARLAGVHPQTLRMYERKGLLSPQRAAGNGRRYSLRDIEAVRLIQQLTQNRGVNLAGVEMVIALRRELDEAQRRMQALRGEVQELRLQMLEEVERVRRSYRADLVPYRAAIVPYRQEERRR